MPIRTATYAFGRSVPFLLERGAAQTIQAPVRHGADGSLVAPDSGTVTIVRTDGTNLVSGAAVSITSSIAGYELTPSASETLGEGWETRWSLTFDSVAYPTFRQSAYLCEYVPPNVVSAFDLYTRIPELSARVPRRQGATTDGGTGEGWQRQIDEAYYELIRRLLEDGQKPWLVREVTGYRDWLLARALQLCVGAISYGPDEAWAQHAKNLHFELQRVEARLRFQYSDDEVAMRRGAPGAIRLAPRGRPVW